MMRLETIILKKTLLNWPHLTPIILWCQKEYSGNPETYLEEQEKERVYFKNRCQRTYSLIEDLRPK